jgi:hypothetical protein
VSKDKLHIDDLFKQLKDYEHPTVMSMFDEIQAKRSDAAWETKFKEYAHSDTDIPPFEGLAMPKSDKAVKPGKAFWGTVILSGIMAFILMGSTAFNSDTIPQNSIRKQNNLSDTKSFTKRSNKTDKSFQKSPSANYNAVEDKKIIKLQKTESIQGKEHQTKQLTHPLANTKVASNKSQLNDIQSSTNVHLGKSTNIKNPNEIIKKNIKTNKSITGTTSPMNEKNTLIQLASKSRKISKKNPNQGLKEILGPMNKVPKLKTKPQFFMNAGINNYSSDLSIPNTSPRSALGFHLNGGLDLGRFGLYSGIEKNNFTYQTALRSIQIYDSIPHIGINGDTIGWFKKNLRDTTIASNLMSNIAITSIPFHFTFKPIHLRKLSLTIGVGLNLNFTRAKELWLDNPSTGYTENIAQNKSVNNNSNLFKRTHIALNMSSRLSYRITPLNELYARIQWIEGQNMLKSKQQILKNRGLQLDIGMKYYFRTVR